MEAQDLPFDRESLEKINEKAIQNQFFTPDHVYIELALLKDIPIGAIYADKLFIHPNETAFHDIQKVITQQLSDYQKRLYHTVEPFFTPVHYSDARVASILSLPTFHDAIFLSAPTTYFLDTLIRHTARNQNHSQPAHKFHKRMINKEQYVLEPTQITYTFNTHPLALSEKVLKRMGEAFGESLGVNIRFINKDPILFDQKDWDSWLSKIDCFYFDNLGRFTRSPFILEKQGQMEFVGRYFFARKRFEKEMIGVVPHDEFEQEIQIFTSRMDIFCDFQWLQNNDVRLTPEREDVPVEDVEPIMEGEPQS